jgi:hypothetical protein
MIRTDYPRKRERYEEQVTNRSSLNTLRSLHGIFMNIATTFLIAGPRGAVESIE